MSKLVELPIKSSIEHHPENVGAPWVVITPAPNGGRIWFACRTEEEAKARLASRKLRAFEAVLQFG